PPGRPLPPPRHCHRDTPHLQLPPPGCTAAGLRAAHRAGSPASLRAPDPRHVSRRPSCGPAPALPMVHAGRPRRHRLLRETRRAERRGPMRCPGQPQPADPVSSGDPMVSPGHPAMPGTVGAPLVCRIDHRFTNALWHAHHYRRINWRGWILDLAETQEATKILYLQQQKDPHEFTRLSFDA
ncbi:unnamed protein product, partial [Urochloa humidicola]